MDLFNNLSLTLADLGGMLGARPPMGPNSFVFAHIFAEKHPNRRSTAGKSWIRLGLMSVFVLVLTMKLAETRTSTFCQGIMGYAILVLSYSSSPVAS